MNIQDINDIIKAVCLNDEDYEKPCISPKYLRQELEQLALEQEERMVNKSEIPTGSTKDVHDNNVGKIEPTTKNDLGVDCISRQAVLNRILKFSVTDGRSVSVTGLWTEVNDMPPVTPQPRLIPVSERLPDTDDEVLCWYEYYHWSQEKVLPEYGIGCYFKETSAWYGEVATGRDVRVIAWMPLPQYREVEE